MRDLFRFLFRARNMLLFAALMVLSLLLLYNGNMHHRAQAFTSSNQLAGVIFTWRKDITDYANLKEVNEQLATENASWRNRHSSAYTPVENIFVRINDTTHRQQYTYLTAKVVNSTWHKQMNFLTLDKGSANEIQEDMGVVGAQGIVGVVHAVSPHFASVKSVLSPDLEISVQLRGSQHFGLLRWDTSEPTTASVVDIAKHVRLATGDTVETRGGDGIFPSGIPVGVVVDVIPDAPGIYLGIKVRLTEDLTRNGFVYIVKDLQRAERDSIQKAHGTP